MSWSVLCFCGTVFSSPDGLHGVCPYCDVPMPGDVAPEAVPVDWNP